MNEEPVILISFPQISIKVMHDRMTAITMQRVGTFTQVQRLVDKHFSHEKDLHSLSLRGIMQLAIEFKDELNKTISN